MAPSLPPRNFFRWPLFGAMAMFIFVTVGAGGSNFIGHNFQPQPPKWRRVVQAAACQSILGWQPDVKNTPTKWLFVSLVGGFVNGLILGAIKRALSSAIPPSTGASPYSSSLLPWMIGGGTWLLWCHGMALADDNAFREMGEDASNFVGLLGASSGGALGFTLGWGVGAGSRPIPGSPATGRAPEALKQGKPATASPQTSNETVKQPRPAAQTQAQQQTSDPPPQEEVTTISGKRANKELRKAVAGSPDAIVQTPEGTFVKPPASSGELPGNFHGMAYDTMTVTDPSTGDPVEVIDPKSLVIARASEAPAITETAWVPGGLPPQGLAENLAKLGLPTKFWTDPSTGMKHLKAPDSLPDDISGVCYETQTMKDPETGEELTIIDPGEQVYVEHDPSSPGIEPLDISRDDGQRETRPLVNRLGGPVIVSAGPDPPPPNQTLSVQYSKAITINGHEDFVIMTTAHLGTISSTKAGATLLEDINRSGKKVVIENAVPAKKGVDPNVTDHGQDGYLKLGKMTVGDDGSFQRGPSQRGPGSDAYIRYEPVASVHCNGKEPWMHAPADVWLYHEMKHARDAVCGLMEPGQGYDALSAWQCPNADLQAVGLGPWATDTLSENAYRAERGFPPRTQYVCP